MVTSYIIVAAREAGAKKAQRSKKYKKLVKLNPQKANEIIERIKKKRIVPFAKKYQRIANAYRKRCKWPSQDLERAKRKYPSELIANS